MLKCVKFSGQEQGTNTSVTSSICLSWHRIPLFQLLWNVHFNVVFHHWGIEPHKLLLSFGDAGPDKISAGQFLLGWVFCCGWKWPSSPVDRDEPRSPEDALWQPHPAQPSISKDTVFCAALLGNKRQKGDCLESCIPFCLVAVPGSAWLVSELACWRSWSRLFLTQQLILR